MHAQVTEAAVGAVELELALPVQGFLGVQVAGMQETGIDLDNAAERTPVDGLADALGGGKEGPLRGTPEEDVGLGAPSVQDGGVGGQVEAQRFLAEQVFAAVDGRATDLLVQMMGYGDINSVHGWVGDQLAIIVSALRGARKMLAKPGKRGGAAVAHRHDFGPELKVGQMTPAGRGAGELAPHQAAPDDAETDGSHGLCSRMPAMRRAALSWKMADALCGSVRPTS